MKKTFTTSTFKVVNVVVRAAGHDDIVNCLLRRFHRLKVDQCNKLGFTALMKAAIHGRTRCAKLLLFAGSYKAMCTRELI